MGWLQIVASLYHKCLVVYGLSPLFNTSLPCKFILQASMPLMYTSCVILIHKHSSLIGGSGNSSDISTFFGKITCAKERRVVCCRIDCASAATHGQGHEKAIPESIPNYQKHNQIKNGV